MNKKKSIAVALVLTLILIIGGMVAYFTDTVTKTDTITLGDNIEISLSEKWTPEDGLGLNPGAVVTKAPSIKNESKTKSAYVFAEIIVPCYAITGTTVDTPLFTFTKNTGWELINTPVVDANSKTITYVYAYGTSSKMTELKENTTTLTSVFNNVTLAPTLTAEQKATANEEINIVVNAYGIQTENMSEKTPAQIFELFGTN